MKPDLMGIAFHGRNIVKSVLMAFGLVLAATPFLLAANPQFEASPEPGTLILLGTGFAGLGVAIWHRSRAKK